MNPLAPVIATFIDLALANNVAAFFHHSVDLFHTLVVLIIPLQEFGMTSVKLASLKLRAGRLAEKLQAGWSCVYCFWKIRLVLAKQMRNRCLEKIDATAAFDQPP